MSRTNDTWNVGINANCHCVKRISSSGSKRWKGRNKKGLFRSGNRGVKVCDLLFAFSPLPHQDQSEFAFAGWCKNNASKLRVCFKPRTTKGVSERANTHFLCSTLRTTQPLCRGTFASELCVAGILARLEKPLVKSALHLLRRAK